MVKDYQVTLLSKSGKYRPISCIVKITQTEDKDLTTDVKAKKEIINKGISKICFKRGWGKLELKTYEYLTVKVRLYEAEKIKAEEKAQYEKIKEEKYRTGEWKRPKKK